MRNINAGGLQETSLNFLWRFLLPSAHLSTYLASNPGPHRHRICDRQEEALPDGRRSGGDEGLGSRRAHNLARGF